MKICFKCKSEKLLKEFHSDKTKSDGKYSSCKACNRRKGYFDARKEQKREYDRKRYDENSEKIKLENSNRYHIKKHEYNKNSVAAVNRDPQRKLKASLRKRICKIVGGHTKGGSAIRDLGCSVEELMKHLESKFKPEMTWNNRGSGKGKWQIDHIKPLRLFDLTKREEFLEVCNFANLQPIWYEDHLLKTRKDLRLKKKCA